jgi:hypothetical protein
MKKISSDATVVYKYILPTLWFGFTGLMIVALAVRGMYGKSIIPMVFAYFGFLIFKLGPWRMVDEVYSGEGFILVKNSGIEEQIPHSDIVNKEILSYRPTKVILQFQRETKFGKQVRFVLAEQITTASQIDGFNAWVRELNESK